MNFKDLVWASIKSIAWVALLLLAFFLIDWSVSPEPESDILGLISFILAFYLLFSVVGWIVVGFPAYVFKSALSRKYYLYPLSAFTFMLVLFIFFDLGLALICGLAAVLQASIFAYYVYKFETKYLC